MPDPMRDIADQLERLAGEIRQAPDPGTDPAAAKSARERIEQEVERAIAEATRRLNAEADRVVATTARVLESTPSAAIAQAEREARERILAVTERACERIEAVDNAQERVAEALSRLGPSPPGRAGGEASRA